MASGRRTSLKGRKRHITDLNMTPFIDLFSVCIVFLLSTAVLDQIAMIQMNMGIEDKPAAAVPKEPVKKIKSEVKVTIGLDQIELFDAGAVQKIERPDPNMAFDWGAIDVFMDGVRAKYPDKTDMLIFSDDKAKYEDLVAVLDRSLARKFEELIVAGIEE